MLIVVACTALIAVASKCLKAVSKRAQSNSSSEVPETDFVADMSSKLACRPLPQLHPQLDEGLSGRTLHLDPAGYFIITTEGTGAEGYIKAAFFTNVINEAGTLHVALIAGDSTE
jgi:hypothetical protein